MTTKIIPKALLGSFNWVKEQYQRYQSQGIATIEQWLKVSASPPTADYWVTDFNSVLHFLYSYRGSQETFNSYRRELERLLQWSWLIKQQAIVSLSREDIEQFIEFCQHPPTAWISTKIVARFINDKPNPAWRPFVVKVSKKAFQEGKRAQHAQFELSQAGLKVLFAVLSSFYSYLVQTDCCKHNPLLQIRQKSKFIRKTRPSPIRRLSPTQWQTVITTAQQLADENKQHERTLFIMQILYGLYLRISELAASARWIPQMCDFFRDSRDNWWFKTVGKGNKERQIAVSDALLVALKRWRGFLNLSPLPTPDDQSPLIPKQRGLGAMTSTRAIRLIVQHCFDRSVEQLHQQQQVDEAEMLRNATVHWLRHTGISDDVQHRPKEHVRDDAGHSSSAVTDRYIDVELLKRAESARDKSLIPKLPTDKK